MAPRSQNPDDILQNLHEGIGVVFEQVHVSLANHKKNCVALYKIQTRAAEVVHQRKGGGSQFVGEEAFQDVFVDMVSRVLEVKKGNGAAGAERVVKFVGTFVKFMNEKVVEAKSKAASSSSSTRDDEDEENPTTRFVARLLSWLLKGFLAKNKVVRHRCVQIVGEMISHLGEIDEDMYTELRDALIERLADKEAVIRAHAVIALSKLVGSEDAEEGEQSILQTLLESVETDPAPEVRRAALLHIPVLPGTLDILLRRTRDVDPVTRKLVYTSLLGGKLKHPKQLTIAQRELIVKDGLGDREAAVRVAAGKVACSWFDWAVGEGGGEDEGEGEGDLGWEGDDGGIMKGLIKLLGLFDVVGPGEAVAVDAVLSIFTTRREVLDAFVFPDTYWKSLTPESVVLARIFADHCTNTKDEMRLESASLPVVTAFAFHVQEAYNSLLLALEEAETGRILIGTEEGQEENETLEEELAKKEVVMSELLRLALRLDYGDEIGRRKVFSVVKDMVAHPELPPGLIERCLDVLKEIMPSERDLIRVVVEIIVELRDPEEPDAEEPAIGDDRSDGSNISTTTRREKAGRPKQKNRDTMSVDERRKADLADMRCLLLCIAMLERVNGSFEDNSTLEGILSDLIVPCVKRKELAMRGKALVSLGLCSLIAKNMALSSFQLFVNQAQNAPAELKVEVLKVIMDLLIMYDQEFFGKSEDTAKQIVDFLLQILEAEESAEAQAVMVTGFCKLLLAGIVTEKKVLMCLALLYVSPTTANNQELRQCLAYFFPVFSYSSPMNQSRVQSIFMSTFNHALRLYEDLDEDEEMIAPYQLGLLMVDWTNPQKAAEIAVDQDLKPTHVDLAIDILIALYDSDRTVDEQKTLLQLLGQLHMNPGLDLRSIQKLNVLLTYHEQQCPFENAVNEKLFDKFSKLFYGLYKEELEETKTVGVEFVDEEFRDIYQRIGVDVPEDGKVRRSRSRGKRRATQSDEEGEEDEEEATGEVEEDEEEHPDESQEDEVVQNGVASDEGEQTTAESESRQNSPDPTPKPDKRTRKPPVRQTRASTKGNRGKNRQVQEESDEENIPPAKTTPTTPKKLGVKRTHPPGSGNLNSPANRKKKRVKAPLKAHDATPTNSDSGSPTTPTKASARPSRGSNRLGGGRGRKAKTPSRSDDEEEVDEADAEEVESMIGSDGSNPTPIGASSDDFGGYE